MTEQQKLRNSVRFVRAERELTYPTQFHLHRDCLMMGLMEETQCLLFQKKYPCQKTMHGRLNVNDFYMIRLQCTWVKSELTYIAHRGCYHQTIFEFHRKYLKSFAFLEYSAKVEVWKASICGNNATSSKIILNEQHLM